MINWEGDCDLCLCPLLCAYVCECSCVIRRDSLRVCTCRWSCAGSREQEPPSARPSWRAFNKLGSRAAISEPPIGPPGEARRRKWHFNVWRTRRSNSDTSAGSREGSVCVVFWVMPAQQLGGGAPCGWHRSPRPATDPRYRYSQQDCFTLCMTTHLCVYQRNHAYLGNDS